MLCECERFAQCNLMKFNVKKSVISVFRRRRSACPARPNFFLGGSVLLVKESICHLGSLFSDVRDDKVSIEKRMKKFYAAVHTVVGRLGRACREEELWKRVMDVQLLSVLSFGSHLWDLSEVSSCHLLATAWRKGIRKGLALKYQASISTRLGVWFQEGYEKIHRAVHSANEMVRGIALASQYTGHSIVWRSVRSRYKIKGLCCFTYEELKSILH